MPRYSFIDFGNEDFVRDEADQTVTIEAEDAAAAEDWLLSNHQQTDWSNNGTRIWCWDKEAGR